MNVIFISAKRGHLGAISIHPKRWMAMALTLSLSVPVASLYAGYRLGSEQRPEPVKPDIALEIASQRAVLAEAQRSAEEDLNALATRLGALQAHVIRLNAVGQRLTRMAGLDDGEFDFEHPPAQGGPDMTDGEPLQVADFVSQLRELELELDDREQQLGVLETLLMNRQLQAEVLPSGMPVADGWVSSYFGTRTDPLNGHKAFHAGLDFAGEKGEPIMAVASGIVSFSGERSGYGNVVEINHGNGYVTRYGHNQKNLVQVGETVKKGQVIAQLGSSGRSTGPHLHLEVTLDGKPVDPLNYLDLAKK